MGSPPRVWGKDKQISRILHLIRITPTCVGKRILGYDRLRGVQDHPHVCGEKLLVVIQLRVRLGSPPRVWGKVRCPLWTGICGTITPTCVGKSIELEQELLLDQDHPHVCGEKVKL